MINNHIFILQLIFWSIIFILRPIFLEAVDYSPLFTKAMINQFSDLLRPIYLGIFSQLIIIAVYFLLNKNKKIIIKEYKLNKLVVILLLSLIIPVQLLIAYKTTVDQSELEKQGRLITDFFINVIPLLIVFTVINSKKTSKLIKIFAFLSLIMSVIITGSKSNIWYFLLAYLIVNYHKINRLKVILLIFIAILINITLNFYRHGFDGDININLIGIYIQMLNRFNGVDYLSTLPADYISDFPRLLVGLFTFFIPRMLWVEKPITSQSLILNESFNEEVGGALVSYTILAATYGSYVLTGILIITIAFLLIFISMLYRKYPIPVLINITLISAFWEYDIFYFVTYVLPRIFACIIVFKIITKNE